MVLANPMDKFYRFRELDMPIKRFKEHSYTILDTSEGQVFIQINHMDEDSKFGNIYISDSTGTKYSLSAEYNIRDPDGQCDFTKIEGLEGIYIQNVFDEEEARAYKRRFSEGTSRPGIKIG